jgi:hypothetical protein
MLKSILKLLSKKLDKLSWLNIKKIYQVNNNQLIDFTKYYYIIILFSFINYYFRIFECVNTYLIIYNNNIRTLKTDNINNIIKESYTPLKRILRRSSYNIKFSINDEIVSDELKNLILSHSYDDLFIDVYTIYCDKRINRLEYSNKIITNLDELFLVKIGDIYKPSKN